MKTIQFTYNGFHGTHEFSIRPLSVKTITKNYWGEELDHPAQLVRLSKGQAQRITKTVCGLSECRCGEGVKEHDGIYELYIPGHGEVRGNYPG